MLATEPETPWEAICRDSYANQVSPDMASFTVDYPYGARVVISLKGAMSVPQPTKSTRNDSRDLTIFCMIIPRRQVVAELGLSKRDVLFCCRSKRRALKGESMQFELGTTRRTRFRPRRARSRVNSWPAPSMLASEPSCGG